MSPRRDREPLEGHGFQGWEPAAPLSEEDRGLVATLTRSRSGFSRETLQVVDERLSSVEGDLVPVCECGWTGEPEAWQSPSMRSARGGQQYIAHEYAIRTSMATERLAAEVAAAALRHAAGDWTGDEQVTRWLKTRAEHIERIGHYDLEV